MILINYFLVITFRILSLLPFRLMYLLSDIFAALLFHVFRYRRTVVFENLRNSFPEKSENEIRSIARKFYRNFSDLLAEVVKSSSITKKQLDRRITFHNYELLDKYFNENRNVVVALGHCGNWELMAMQLALISPYTVQAIVKPMSSEFWEKYFSGIRQRFTPGALLPFKSAYRKIVEQRKQKMLYLFAVDQTPTKNEINYWTRFLNQETPVYLGIEKVARTINAAVVFFDIRRTRRGHYQISIIDLFPEPNQTADFEITEKHVHLLEQLIRETPDNWLWSHRRWKHKKQDKTN